MSAQAFDIKTSRDFFKELLAQYKEFKQNPTSSRLAINCALWSYHLCEWIKAEYGEIVSSSHCASLSTMRDIGNGTKHFRIDRGQPNVVATELHGGDFSDDFNLDFDISALQVTTADGRTLQFEDELSNVIQFWSGHPRLVNTEI